VSPGDTILVYPLTGDTAYEKVAVYVNKRKIIIRGVAPGNQPVRLVGTNYDYSGAGSVPRAMFQFNLGADSCLVENFDISQCRNTSYNGAAFRINQANDIIIRNCEIHHNDMGIMSNGSVNGNTAANQLIENCIVHDNGNDSDPGYNHNFYVGGTSVTIRGCNIYSATTGHNLKSRAHLTFVEGCFIHDSPNRELDLVDDAENTTVEGSHALVSGCIIVKDPICTGNKAVIHFGQDGGNDHKGTIHIVHCTIITPFISPVVDLSAPSAGSHFWNCIVLDITEVASNQVLINARNGAIASNSAGNYLWMSKGFSVSSFGTFDHVTIGSAASLPKFIDAPGGNFGLSDSSINIVDAGLICSDMLFPTALSGRSILTFINPHSFSQRIFVGKPDLGAYEWKSSQSLIKVPIASIEKSISKDRYVVFNSLGKIISNSEYLNLSRTIGIGFYILKSKACDREKIKTDIEISTHHLTLK
jgi:hypothetical protein